MLNHANSESNPNPQDNVPHDQLPVALFQHVNDPTDETALLESLDLASILDDTATRKLQGDILQATGGPIYLDPVENNVPAAPVEEPQEPNIVHLEDPRPLSKSLLWKIQEDYYESLGINAWSNSVPFFITNSTFIAEAYADMIVAFLQDYLPNLNKDEPVYIMEMATGTGRFAYYLLKELTRKMDCLSALRDLKICYVMTDFTENNIVFWEDHDKFKPFIEAGQLDFAIFRPEDYDTLDLRVAGTTLCSDTLKNPLIAMANYFFDTIRHDLFRVQSKKLEEGLLELRRNLDRIVDIHQERIDISEVVTELSYRPLYNPNYFADPKWNEILKYYRHNVKNGALIFPTGAFHCIKNLQAMSNNNLVLLSSDKAFTCLDSMIQHDYHGYAVHGSFSYMVNYDAIGRYFENEGGHFFRTMGKNLSLQTVCCISVKEPVAPVRYDQMSYVYQERINRGHAINSMSDMQMMLFDNVLKENGIIPFESLIAFIRMSLCDPRAFFYCAPRIMDIIGNLNSNQQADLLNVTREVWDNHYAFRGEINLPFWVAQIYFGLNMFEESLSFFNITIDQFGEHDVIHFFMAHCHDKLGRREKAYEHYTRTLEINPGFTEAQQCLDLLKVELKK